MSAWKVSSIRRSSPSAWGVDEGQFLVGHDGCWALTTWMVKVVEGLTPEIASSSEDTIAIRRSTPGKPSMAFIFVDCSVNALRSCSIADFGVSSLPFPNHMGILLRFSLPNVALERLAHAT